jgi:hypothetical protein
MHISSISRVIAFVVLSLLVFNGIWFLAVPLCIYCLARYNAYEFVIMAFCIDVYFGSDATIFPYTLVTLAALCVAIIGRPYLWYGQDRYS